MKKLLFMATAFALLGPWGGTAAAQQYPPTAEDLTVSDNTVAPGQTITVSGCCFTGTVDITIESAPQLLGSADADASGVFRLEVIIPGDIEAGIHSLKATGEAADGSGTLVLSATVHVTEAGSGVTGLAFTGKSTGSLVRLAVALVVVGGILVAVVRRRSTASSAVTA